MKFKIFIMRYLRALKKKKIIVILIFLCSLAIGIAKNFKILDDKYEATSSIYTISNLSYTDLNQQKDVYTFQTYADVITSKKVADRAAEMLGNDYLDGATIRNMVTYSNKKGSPIYKIHVITNSPQLSITVANAVATAAAIEINTITESNNSKILDEAYEYKQVFDGKREQIKSILVFAFIGLAIGFIIILIMACSSTKVETVNDVTLNGEIEILGVIPNFDVE